MSKEYIEKEAALALSKHLDRDNGNKHFVWGVETYAEYLQGLPPADVKPVARGEWIDFGDELDKSAGRHSYQCSHCFTDASYFISGFEWDEWTAPHFCPNCGADMREEKEDGRM